MSESMGEPQRPEPGPPPGSAPPPPPAAPPPPPPPPPQSYSQPPPAPSAGYGGPGYGGASSPYANRLAEWPKRAGAYAIDYIAPFFAVFVVGFILGAIVDVLGLIVFLFGYLAAFAFAIYTSYLGGQTGQSIGKQQMGIRLVRESDGQPIGGGLGIGRYFVHIIDAVPCYLGFLWPLWDEKKQTFTDKVLGTIVLDDAKR